MCSKSPTVNRQPIKTTHPYMRSIAHYICCDRSTRAVYFIIFYFSIELEEFVCYWLQGRKLQYVQTYHCQRECADTCTIRINSHEQKHRRTAQQQNESFVATLMIIFNRLKLEMYKSGPQTQCLQRDGVKEKNYPWKCQLDSLLFCALMSIFIMNNSETNVVVCICGKATRVYEYTIREKYWEH